MWNLFQQIISYGIKPDSCLFLYCIKENVSTPFINHDACIEDLINAEMVTYEENEKGKTFQITQKGNILIETLDGYFLKAKKKTNIQLMGKEFLEKIESYREIFPKGKLPSGKPARNNVKALSESFRWFFETYDYTWDEVIAATKMYVNEYRQNNYLYMQTSQYFVAKQDKNKVKTSTLADYCDMIKDGVQTEEKHFTEKVV